MIKVKATIKGTLVDEFKTDRIIRKQIQHEVIGAIEQRMTRHGSRGSGGKGLGVQRNRVTADAKFAELTVESTLVTPRVKGVAWKRKNISLIKAMAPRVANAAARRIEAELG